MGAVSALEPIPPLVGPILAFKEANRNTKGWSFQALAVTERGDQIPSLKIKELADKVDEMVFEPQLIHETEERQFYRFNVDLARGAAEKKFNLSLDYKDSQVTSQVSVPGTKTPIHFSYFSCNGFHDPAKAEQFGDIMPMWRDHNAVHDANPFSLMFGGGDQLYCDPVFLLPSIQAWRATKKEAKRFEMEFTDEMRNEVENYYLNNYLRHFNKPEFRKALASIPNIFTPDDHDFFDGAFSLREEEQNCPVIKGICEIAKKHILLWQMLLNEEEVPDAGFIGKGLHKVTEIDNLGILTLDARTERTQHQIVSEESYEAIFERLYNMSDDVQQLIVMLTVPIIYPEFKHLLELLKNVANPLEQIRFWLGKGPSDLQMKRATDQEDLLDDFMDHWNHPNHMNERLYFILKLLELSLSKMVRISVLAGDVHCASQAQFQSPGAVPFEIDPYGIKQFVSSGIGNEPPPLVLKGLMYPDTLETEKFRDEKGTSKAKAVFNEWVGTSAKGKPITEKFCFDRNYLEGTVTPKGLEVQLHVEDSTNPNRKVETITRVFKDFVPNLSLELPQDKSKERHRFCQIL